MRRLALLPLLALLAACGGGANEKSGPLSRGEYTKQANAICLDVEEKLEALGGFEDFEELSKETAIARDAIRKSAKDLRALEPPVKLRAQHRKLADLQDETADVADRISAGAADNDQIEMQTQAERADKLTAETNATARKLGLMNCVSG